MSWLYSQALVAEFLPDICSDGEPSAQWNVMPTPQGFWRNDKMMEFSRLSRFGPTLRLLTESHGEAVLTSFLAAFPARTLARPTAAERESTANEADSGLKCSGWFAKWSHDSSSWKTAQCLLLGGSEEFSATWPRWGSMRNGVCWERPTLERPTDENESGYWPTVTVCGNHNRKGVSKTSGDGLATAVKLWPTPTAMNATGGAALCKWGGSGARKKLKEMVTPAEMNGPLNPTWVEWLMGWPADWTDLNPLAMDKFQQWQQQHSTFFPNDLERSA